MSTFWIAGAVLSAVGTALAGMHRGWHMRDAAVAELHGQVERLDASRAEAVAGKGELLEQVDGLNAEIRRLLDERAVLETGIDLGASQLASMTTAFHQARDSGEVAIAQAARWKSERDALRAKIDRMTSGLHKGRQPKVAAE